MALTSPGAGGAERRLYRRGRRAIAQLREAEENYHLIRWRWLAATDHQVFWHFIERTEQAIDDQCRAEQRLNVVVRKLDRCGATDLAKRLRAEWHARFEEKIRNGPLYMTCSRSMTSTN